MLINSWLAIEVSVQVQSAVNTNCNGNGRKHPFGCDRFCAEQSAHLFAAPLS